MIKNLEDFQLKSKRVIVRCDFNVPIDEKGNISDNYRIRKSLPTIDYLIKEKAKVIILTHLGDFEEKAGLSPVQKELSNLLKKEIKKTNDCVGKEVEKEIEAMKEGDVILLENVRKHKEEKENDLKFAKELSKLGDIFINDAFASSHRNHASIVGITNYLPSGAGFLLKKELAVLSKIMDNPWRPFGAIIGGVKFSTRINLIKNLINKADHILFGGEIANNILMAKGICVNKTWEGDKDSTSEIRKIDITSPKIHLPIDVVVSGDKKGESYVRSTGPGVVKKEEFLLDIGPETIRVFSDVLKDMKTIIWAGPLGLFEEPLFEKGTREIGERIARNHRAYKVAGGGDTVFSIFKFNLERGFDHISTGGGAMLSFLSGDKLPGIEALEKNGDKKS
ncbi:MAG: phosphoglycerate kinase [Candidatus Pacebacteria bacterium]|nr:phosphoglycerate kinase [Candidatus Paceibacterota bacterium]MDD4201216.1 phosphoglycerate kinase [Candidatus Paceibacterota bacterium]